MACKHCHCEHHHEHGEEHNHADGGLHGHAHHEGAGHDHNHGGHHHDDGHEDESAGRRAIIIRIVVSAVLLITAVIARKQFGLSGWAEAAVFLVPYLIIGWDVLSEAAVNIVHGEIFDENFLMALATLGAVGLREYPEAVFVMLFSQIGELFEDYAVDKSRGSIENLMDIRPDFASVERNGAVVTVSPEEVAVGETIIVRPGEKIPLDGVITEGSSTVDTAALTGESLPRDVEPESTVISGCVNLTGLIKITVTKEFGESTVSKILALVQDESGKKAKAEKFITRFSRWYTPAVVVGAVLYAVLPPLVAGFPWRDCIRSALIFLVISCPCALVISVPMGFFAGIGSASKRGILIKGGKYMESLSKMSVAVFDKTGTLTKGTFSVTAVHTDRMEKIKLLELAALAESHSSHPISQSITAAWCRGSMTEEGAFVLGCEITSLPRVIDTNRVSSVEERAGFGIKAVVDGKTVCCGNNAFMASLGIEEHSCHKAGTIIHIAVDGVYAGHIVISDEIKESAAVALQKLKKLGVKKTVMLTGDSDAVAKTVADAVGVDEYYAGLLPADKVACMEKILAGGTVTAFAGDGINDAPVLTRADIGIAMGALGSDAAIEAADVVLMDDNPVKIADAVCISRKTLAIVRQNIVFSLAVKALVMIFGVLGVAFMWEAIFADVGVLVLAVLNSMRAGREC